MKKKRYTEEQVISILKEHEAGAPVKDLARHHAMAENTIYRWKAKFGGMADSRAKYLRGLERENGDGRASACERWPSSTHAMATRRCTPCWWPRGG